MSADDPTDDELDREAAREVPLALGGTARHAPKLETRSRAINPRAQLQAEAESQSRDSGGAGILSGREMRGLMGAHTAPAGIDSRAAALRGLPRTPAGRLSFLRDLGPADPTPAPPPPEPTTEPEAWDRYVAAALGACALLSASGIVAVGELEATALDLADRLLEERRRRFP